MSNRKLKGLKRITRAPLELYIYCRKGLWVVADGKRLSRALKTFPTEVLAKEYAIKRAQRLYKAPKEYLVEYQNRLFHAAREIRLMNGEPTVEPESD